MTEFTKLVEAIRKGLKPRDDGHLELPDHVQWPDLESNLLFVRSFYADFYNNVLNGFDAGSPHRRFVVTGNPGIGKSSFGWYVFARLVAEQPKKIVMYQAEKSSAWVVQPGNSGVELTRFFTAGDVHRYPKADTVVISDGIVPPGVAAFTLFIASPRKALASEMGKEFEKLTPRVCFFPVFNETEMEALRQVAFPDVAKDEADRRMRIWGGNPRNVLRRAVSEDQNRLLQSVEELTLDKIMKAFKSVGSAAAAEVSHRLVNVVPRGWQGVACRSDLERYESPLLQWASHTMRAYVARRIEAERRLDILQLVDDSRGEGLLGAARGDLFEPLALRWAATGASAKVRLLSGQPVEAASARGGGVAEEVQTVSFPRLKLRKLQGTLVASALPEDIKTMHLRSPTRTTAAIDGLLWAKGLKIAGEETPLRLCLVNATVAVSHNIVAVAASQGTSLQVTGGLGPAAAALKKKFGGLGVIDLLWLVPHDRWDDGWKSVQKVGISRAAKVKEALRKGQHVADVDGSDLTVERVDEYVTMAQGVRQWAVRAPPMGKWDEAILKTGEVADVHRPVLLKDVAVELEEDFKLQSNAKAADARE